MAKRHHAITISSSAIVSVLVTLRFVSAQATELYEAGETTQACMSVIDQLLSIF